MFYVRCFANFANMKRRPQYPLEALESVSLPLFVNYQPLKWQDILTLMLGYVLLDWISFIHALHGLNITPWSPAPALGLVYLLKFGWRVLAPLVMAILLADLLVRHLPTSLWTSIPLSLCLALGYGCIAHVLRVRLARLDISRARQGLFEWAAIVTVGSLLVSLMFVTLLYGADLIPVNGWYAALTRYWVGDVVGVLITMPMLWMLLDARGRFHLFSVVWSRDAAGYVGGAALALWVAFGLGGSVNSHYFYLLFLPVAWAATRQGLPGAIFSAAIVQIGIIGVVEFLGLPTALILEVQILTVVLVLFGFFIGIVVDEKQRISLELQQTLRLAAAGEMAGALAHELNQPLSALATYGAACEKLIQQGGYDAHLQSAVSRMVAESYRAAEVLRRLRDFFRTGTTKLELVRLADLIDKSVAPFEARFKQLGVEFHHPCDAHCEVLADGLQLELVLRNLIGNALDAVAGMPQGRRTIEVTVQVTGYERVRVSLRDSGPGLSADGAKKSFEAFQSTKTTGMGLGLVISRAIVEAHGGILWAADAPFGLFHLELPLERDGDRG